MPLSFGPEICQDPAAAERREWLATNGIGGFACGTLAGLLTRRYHGLLVAALRPPLGRTLLVAKLDTTVRIGGREFPLYTNRWADGSLELAGLKHLTRFRLEGAIPIWTYQIGDAHLERAIWMEPGANTTYVRYQLVEAARPLSLAAQALVNRRNYHGETRAGGLELSVRSVEQGLEVAVQPAEAPYYLFAQEARVEPATEWYRDFYLAVEAERGLGAVEDHLHAGQFSAELAPGDSLTFVLTADPSADLDGDEALARRRRYEARRMEAVPTLTEAEVQAGARHGLVQAADAFIVRRALPDDPDGRTVIAGYPWFSDWGRDTMIALPGLTLATGRARTAARILRTFAHHIDQGMLPNRFPDEGETPEYNTVDATLWFFEAVGACYEATGDEALLRELTPALLEIIDWHERGTRYQIRVDPADGLLRAGEPGVQLTWMDAKVDDWVVTPRIGKPVEVNALWYNALRRAAGFARELGEDPARLEALAERARAGFARFWDEELGYCLDVLDGPQGDDPALRPNQLFAVSLPHSPLTPRQRKAVVDVCGRRLLTPYGLRSLAPGHPNYIGRYSGDRRARDGAYHQGTVWSWLIGPYVMAHLRVYRDPAQARTLLAPLLEHLNDYGLGTVSEIFDGDPPHTARGCFAQAWSVAELLRALAVLDSMQAETN